MYLNNVTSTGFANSDAQAQTTREATIVQHLTHVHALAKRLRSSACRSDGRRAAPADAANIIGGAISIETASRDKESHVYELHTAKSGLKLKLFPDRTAEHRNVWGSVPQLIELFLDYPVVDRTGLSGFFDTDYHNTWNVGELREELQQARPVNLAPGMAFRGLAPSVFHEVEAEYGLTLKKVTAPSDFLVIEHVERPSDN
jgi:hypothetical protein